MSHAAALHDPDAPFYRKLYNGWLAIAARFGGVQTLVTLALFYAVVIGPVATIIQVGRGDLLAKRGLRADGSAWQKADSVRPDLERARRQF
jgi:hypothetical protein